MAGLVDLNIGECGKILGFQECPKPYRQKLLAMGLTRGAKFTVVRRAPLGDPIQISLRGFALSLRQHEASALMIERINEWKK
ncbi:MAG: ferrous iron transport protein A [Legionellales bacterium]|nr:ferrous iron transport protein A [Legionellales bacterium]